VRLIPLFLIVFSLRMAAQTIAPDTFPPLTIGSWQQHLPWQRAFYVTQNADKVYISTEWAIVEIDKAERSPRFITKVEGLSDMGVNIVRYNPVVRALFVSYINSNIDIYRVEDGTVINLPFIRTNNNISGDKNIYDVAFDGQFAYLACGFGLIKLNLEREEVVFTTFTNGVVVRSCSVYKEQVYMGTDEGLYRISIDDPNPIDFSRWQAMGPIQGFPAGQPVTALRVYKQELYSGIGSTLYRYDGAAVNTVETRANRMVRYLSAEGQGLMIGWRKDSNGEVSYISPDGPRFDIHWTCDAGKPIYGIEDGYAKFWFADESEEFRYFDLVKNTCDRFVYNSPFFHPITDLALSPGGTLLVATQGAAQNLSPLGARQGIYILKDGQWKRLYEGSNPELVPNDCGKDLWRVEAHPSEDKFYAGSFVGGVLEVTGTGEKTKCYTKDNSILQDAGASGTTRTAIGGLAFDRDKNLWIANYDASSPIAVLKPDGKMLNFSNAFANNFIGLTVDANGYKWLPVGFNGGILVYDSGASLESAADDRYRHILTSNSVLKSNTVNCVAVDLDGDVWVGTQQGVVTFECGSNVFDPALCTGRRRIVEVDDFNAYLLETEDVRAIAIDGANRKWFGTTNGIFVQSPDGTKQVAQYSTTNSPLFDNTINAMTVDPKTGVVWVGTEKGLISLRTDATEGGVINNRAPYAYPNPVAPDYDGPIAIYGLARDANVKITDAAGHLVYEGKALGGQAVWDGRDYLGRRVASGVYLIMATSVANFEQPDAVIAKVVILN
jgi:sugar lactone lactonase YvrE